MPPRNGTHDTAEKFGKERASADVTKTQTARRLRILHSSR